ncbi:hypothetical protein HN935_02440 [archaeon]|jgi:hypothetical protein|nr:hypothetical protein [archaeon]
MGIIEIIENAPAWKKWLGASSLIFIIAFLIVVSVFGGNEVVTLPSDVAEIRQNATELVVEETVSAGGEIAGAFADAGKEMAKTVDDPILSAQIIFLMWLLGVLLAFALFLKMLEVVGIDIDAIIKSLNK